MPLFKTEGIVLRTIDFGEADRIVTFFTRDFGKIKAVVKGVRRTRSRYGSAVELLSRTQVFLWGKPGRELFRMTQCCIVNSFKNLREDLGKLGAGAYIAELIDQLTEPHEKSPEIYHLLLTCLSMLEKEDDFKKIIYLFSVRLITLAGWKFNLANCSYCKKPVELSGRTGKLHLSGHWGGLLCGSCVSKDRQAIETIPRTVQHLRYLQRVEIGKFRRLKLSLKEKQELERVLEYFLVCQTGREFKALKFLKETVNES